MKKTLLVILTLMVVFTLGGCGTVDEKVEDLVLEEAFDTSDICEIIENEMLKEDGVEACVVRQSDDGTTITATVFTDDGKVVDITVDTVSQEVVECEIYD